MDNEFATERLLQAVGVLDELRGLLSDSAEEPGTIPRPPEIRDDLLKLHGLVFNGGFAIAREDMCKASVLLEAIDMALFEISQRTEKIEGVLQDLRDALPEFDEDEYAQASDEMFA